jgi:hypothetical protein
MVESHLEYAIGTVLRLIMTLLDYISIL